VDVVATKIRFAVDRATQRCMSLRGFAAMIAAAIESTDTAVAAL
jgi:hypothetical protein